MIFDTHAHYDDEAFDEDREQMIASLPPAGIRRVIDVGASVKSYPVVKRIADSYDFIYGALGLHPDDVGGFTPEFARMLKKDVAEDDKIVAVGEIGLDYHWDVEPHETQIRCFKEQIEIAMDVQKPIIVHSRAAAQDTLQVIQEMYGSGSRGSGIEKKGIMHCYAYSLEQAKIYTGLGFYLGIGGVLTYKNSKKLKKIVAEIPLTNIVLETDCPYMSPEPKRGTRNSSLNLPYVVETIAELKGITADEVERVTWDNACRLFSIRFC